jgi:hypothetical protein
MRNKLTILTLLVAAVLGCTRRRRSSGQTAIRPCTSGLTYNNHWTRTAERFLSIIGLMDKEHEAAPIECMKEWRMRLS